MRGEHPIAFVEFADITTAANAMKALQGATRALLMVRLSVLGALVGTTRIRIEFARKRMNESRKASTNDGEEDKEETFGENSSFLSDETY